MLKNEIVENKEKGFIRKKIANFRQFNKKKGMAIRGYTHFCYIYKDRLRFVRLSWSSGFANNKTDYVTVKYQRGQFIYSKNGHKTSLTDVCTLFNTQKMTFTKTHLLRVQRTIKEWSESLGHTYKSSKEPKLDLIFAKLVWPSLQRISGISNFTPSKNKSVGSLLRRYLTLKEIIRKILGSCGKKTYKLVCEKIKEHNISFVLDKLYTFKRLFTIDDIQLMFARPGFILIPAFATVHLGTGYPITQYKILEYLKQFTKARLLSENPQDFDPIHSSFFDAVKMWNEAGKPEIQRGISLREHHDQLSLQTRRKRDGDYDLNPSEELLSIDGLEIGDYKLVTPKTKYQLINWGNIMSNCIASYANQVKNRECDIFGILFKNELFANISLYKDCNTNIYNITQFYGKFNSSIDRNITKLICDNIPFKINLSGF